MKTREERIARMQATIKRYDVDENVAKIRAAQALGAISLQAAERHITALQDETSGN